MALYPSRDIMPVCNGASRSGISQSFPAFSLLFRGKAGELHEGLNLPIFYFETGFNRYPYALLVIVLLSSKASLIHR